MTDIATHFLAFRRALTNLILEYHVDEAANIKAACLAEFIIDTIAAAHNLAGNLVDREAVVTVPHEGKVPSR